MSIHAAIKRHCRNGRLFPLEMTDLSHRVVRGLYLSTEVHALLEGPWIAEEGEFRMNKLRADFEAFVRMEPITMCLVPHKAGTATFGRLAEPEEEIWDFRSRTPAPVMRIFGRFAAPNKFIAFNWSPRTKPWNGRDGLGNKNDPRWEAVKAECRQQWETLFPKHEPVHGDDVHDYVTDSNAFDILSR